MLCFFKGEEQHKINADLLLLDDKRARVLATRLGLRVLSTLGILILVKKKSL